MSNVQLARAADKMRREDTAFLHLVADILMEAAICRGMAPSMPFVRLADRLADEYLSDPGDIPAGAS